MTDHAQTLLIEQEFPALEGFYYFNHAAMGPWPCRTRDVVARFATQCGPDILTHWPDWFSREKRLRQRLGTLVGCASDDISLLKNTSEGLSLLAAGIAWRPGDQVVTLTEEFSSNRWPWQQCTPAHVGLKQVQRAPGEAVHEALIRATDSVTRVISVSTVQYASGEAVDLPALSEHCQKHQIMLVVDAIQSLGALPLDLKTCPVDALACGAHKWLLAAEGLGFLYTSPRMRESLAASQVGWRMVDDPFAFPNAAPQPLDSGRRFEAGTLNTVGILALESSLSLYEELGAAAVSQRICSHVSTLIEGLISLGVEVVTPTPPERRAGIVSFKSGTTEATHKLHQALRERGVVSTIRHGMLRLSPHYATPGEHVSQVLDWIQELAE